VIEIDGASHSGSGTIVRQVAAYAALTGQSVHMTNARARRARPGLQRQHLVALRAIRDIVGGSLEGATLGSREFRFSPGDRSARGRYRWDIGSAGSTTSLSLALLPVLAVRSTSVEIELTGGVFQDHAPSLFHVQHVLVHLLARMGLEVRAELVRPGYVPSGGGVIRLVVGASPPVLRPLVAEHAGAVQRIWGIAFSSHLAERNVSHRMAAAARQRLASSGYDAHIDERDDVTASQAGAACALFADLSEGVRLGADRAGAPHRRAEAVGAFAARRLAEEIACGVTVDRFAADQLIPFTAQALGTSRVRIGSLTKHVETGMWLARTFLGASARLEGSTLVIRGARRSGPVRADAR
jgi:RNA 3'-terminal phosphate cyclase (ATP)